MSAEVLRLSPRDDGATARLMKRFQQVEDLPTVEQCRDVNDEARSQSTLLGFGHRRRPLSFLIAFQGFQCA